MSRVKKPRKSMADFSPANRTRESF